MRTATGPPSRNQLSSREELKVTFRNRDSVYHFSRKSKQNGIPFREKNNPTRKEKQRWREKERERERERGERERERFLADINLFTWRDHTMKAVI